MRGTSQWGSEYVKINENSGKIGNELTRLDAIVRNFPINPIFQDPVPTFSQLAIKYPSSEFGWVSLVSDKGVFYQYNGTKWANTGLTAFPTDVATQTDLASKVDKKVTYNVTQVTGVTYADKTAARNAIPANLRGLGQIVTYELTTGWINEQYIGTDVSGWATESNWKVVGEVTAADLALKADIGNYYDPINLGFISKSLNGRFIFSATLKTTYFLPVKKGNVITIGSACEASDGAAVSFWDRNKVYIGSLPLPVGVVHRNIVLNDNNIPNDAYFIRTTSIIEHTFPIMGITLANTIRYANDIVSNSINYSGLYFTGHILFNFAAKTVSVGLGYFSDGNTLFSLNAHNITWSTADLQYMYYSRANQKFYIQEFGTTKLSPADILIGIVDQNGFRTSMSWRNVDLGKNEPLYINGFISSNTAIIYLDFNANKGFTLRNDAGMVLSNQGGDYKPLLAGELNFPESTNTQYIFFNTISQRLESFAYNAKPSQSFKNMWFIGIVNSQVSTYHLNALQVILNGEPLRIFTKSLADQLGKPLKSFFPATNWINKAWNSALGTDSIFFDSRCIISSSRQLQNIKINVSTAGTVGLYLLDMNFNILYNKTVTLSVGLNNATIEGITYTKSMYVGFLNITGSVRTILPAENTGLGYKRLLSTGVTSVNNYSYAFEIETIDYTGQLVNRVKVLEDRFIPTSSDINALLLENDVVCLQPRDYLVTTPIEMKSGKVLQGSFGKTRLILSNGCKKHITATGSTDVKMSGFETVGTQVAYNYDMNGIVSGPGIIATEAEALAFTYMGDEIGIELNSCERVILENLKIRNLTGNGMRINRVGRDYIWGMKVNNVFISNCYNGILGENEHEFSNYNNFNISLCQIGNTFNSGNLIFNNGIVTRCRVGSMLTGGYNHAHGIISNMEIKHNQIAGILCKDVTNGQSFQGVYVSYCNVVLRDSSGIYFNNLKMGNGSILCSNTAGITGRNVIDTLVKRNSNVTVINTGNLQIANTINLFDNI